MSSSDGEGGLAGGTTNSRAGGDGGGDGGSSAAAFKYLTLEAIVLSLHARSCIRRRFLHPAVPPIGICTWRLDTVAVTISAGTRTFGSNRDANRIVSSHTQFGKHTLQEHEKGIVPNVGCRLKR